MSIVFKDSEKSTLKTSSFEDLTRDECERFCEGLYEGLKNTKKGDKGTLMIDPDLTDQGLFRNKLSHKALLVEFEVKVN